MSPDGTRRQLIAGTLAGRFRWLQFPTALERDFRADYARRSLAVVQRVLPWITLLYGSVALTMPGTAGDAAFALWRDNAMLPVLLVLAWLWIATYTGLLGRRIHLQTGIVMAVALTATTRTVFLLGDDPAAIATSYQVIYLLIITGTTLRLRFFPAIGWMLLAAMLAILGALAAGRAIDWPAFVQYGLAPGLMAAVIAYVMEYRDRTDWLKSQRMDLDLREMNGMRERADADNRRQRITGEYLQRVGGNLTATEIAGRTLSFLIEHTGAQVGVVFLVRGDRLRRAAVWGLEGETASPDDLGRGETLIGQAAENRRRLRLTHLPPDYHVIRTATGAASPAELLVLPVCHEERSLAVLELAALSPLADADVELADRIADAMAGMLVAAQAREALARVDLDDFSLT